MKYVVNKEVYDSHVYSGVGANFSSLWSACREETKRKTMKEFEIYSLKEGQFLLNYSLPMYEFSWLPFELK